MCFWSQAARLLTTIANLLHEWIQDVTVTVTVTVCKICCSCCCLSQSYQSFQSVTVFKIGVQSVTGVWHPRIVPLINASSFKTLHFTLTDSEKTEGPASCTGATPTCMFVLRTFHLHFANAPPDPTTSPGPSCPCADRCPLLFLNGHHMHP